MQLRAGPGVRPSGLLVSPLDLALKSREHPTGDFGWRDRRSRVLLLRFAPFAARSRLPVRCPSCNPSPLPLWPRLPPLISKLAQPCPLASKTSSRPPRKTARAMRSPPTARQLWPIARVCRLGSMRQTTTPMQPQTTPTPRLTMQRPRGRTRMRCSNGRNARSRRSTTKSTNRRSGHADFGRHGLDPPVAGTLISR